MMGYSLDLFLQQIGGGLEVEVGPGELGQLTAQLIPPFDQDDRVAGPGNIQCGLHARDATPNNQHPAGQGEFEGA